MLGKTGTVKVGDDFVVGLAGTFLTGLDAYGLGALLVVSVAGAAFLERRRRLAAGLGAESAVLLWIRTGIAAALVWVGLVVLQQDRGLPLSLVLLIGLIVVMDYVACRTRFGRMVSAVGGNAEAARRVGIP